MADVSTPTAAPVTIKDYRYRLSRRIPFFYGWIIVVNGFLSSFVGGGLQSFTFSLFVTPMTRDLGWTRAMLIGATTARTYAHAAVSPIFGPLVDRHGPRYLMVMSTFVGLGAALLLSRVSEVWHFYAIYIVLGIAGQAAAGFLSSATVSLWFVNKRGRAAAWATMGNALSGSILVPFTVFVMGIWGWRGAWLANGLLFLPMIPLTFLLVKQPQDLGLRPDGAKTDAEASRVRHRRGGAEPTVSWTLKEVIRTRTFWVLIIANVVGHAPIGSVILYENPFIQDEGFSAGLAATILSLHATSAIGARHVWGLLLERFHSRYIIMMNYAACAVGISILLLGIRLHFAPLLFVGAVTYGLSVGGNAVIGSVVSADFFGRNTVGTIRGVMGPVQTVLLGVLPLAVAFIRDTTGTYWLPFLAMIGMFLAGSALMALATPLKRREPAATGDQPGH